MTISPPPTTRGWSPATGSGSSRISGSTNGTYLDRTKVVRPTPVPIGVPVRIGKTVLELRR